MNDGDPFWRIVILVLLAICTAKLYNIEDNTGNPHFRVECSVPQCEIVEAE